MTNDNNEDNNNNNNDADIIIGPYRNQHEIVREYYEEEEKKKKKKNKKRSLFAESEALEQKLKVAKQRAERDRNSLTAQNARDEVAGMLLKNAFREMFERVDKLQGGSFIHGSMATLNADMWRQVLRKK